MRALVVGDVCFYREGIARALRDDGMSVQATTTTHEDLARLANESDVVLVDLATESLSRTLGAVVGRAPVVGLALTSEPPVAGAAALGVRAFVGCDQSLATLVRAVRAAAAGEAVCPASIAAALFTSLGRVGEPTAQLPVEALTRRERDIARLLVRGLSNKEIASALSIEGATVKNHVHQILRKLDVTRRGQVADQLRGVWTERSTALS